MSKAWMMRCATTWAILAVTYLGVRSDALGNFFRRRLAVVKCSMALLFAGLGALVIITV